MLFSSIRPKKWWLQGIYKEDKWRIVPVCSKKKKKTKFIKIDLKICNMIAKKNETTLYKKQNDIEINNYRSSYGLWQWKPLPYSRY